MSAGSLKHRRDLALGAGAELFYDMPLEIVRGDGVYLYDRGGLAIADEFVGAFDECMRDMSG